MPAPLVITADSVRKFFNYPDPIFTVHYSGFVNNENASIVSGLIVNRNPGESIGTYDLVPSGATAPNYTISYYNGKLTIEASTATKLYQEYMKHDSASKYGIVMKKNPALLRDADLQYSVKTPMRAQIRVYIYSSVGDLIYKKDYRTDPDGNSGILHWNLTNKNNCTIGVGTYLMIVKTDDIVGKYTYKALIGVKR